MSNIYIVSPHVGDSWKSIQKQFIAKHTKDSYQLFQFDVPDKCHHLKALHYCLVLIDRQNPKLDDLIIEMDSDAFPINDNWITKIKEYLENNEFTAVQRLENPNFYKTIAHPCFCAWYYKTKINFNWTARNPYIIGWETRKWKKLHRTNKKNVHSQMFGIYDNLVLHTGAGSRLSQVKNEHYFKRGIPYYDEFWKNPERFINNLAGTSV